MADTTLTPPILFADHSRLNYSQEVADDLLVRLYEAEAVLALFDIVQIGGGGSKTLRRGNYAALGANAAAALTGETGAVVDISRTIGDDDLTVAAYGFGVGATFDQMIFSRAAVAQLNSLDEVMMSIPGVANTTARGLMATAGSGITASVGSATYRVSVDTMIAAQANFNGQYTPGPVGAPRGMFHSTAIEHLRDSMRAEPTFVQSGAAMGIQGFDQSAIMPNFGGFGVDIVKTDDVVDSGGAYQNFIADPGAMSLGVGNTGLVNLPQNTAFIMAIPLVGALVLQDLTRIDQRTARYIIVLYQGASIRDSAVFRQVKVLGKNS